jgi:hypothetical protein
MRITLNKPQQPNLSSSTDIFIEILNHNFYLENSSTSFLATNPSSLFSSETRKNVFHIKEQLG